MLPSLGKRCLSATRRCFLGRSTVRRGLISPSQQLRRYTVLITGGNRGIGLEFVSQYLARDPAPNNVIACCRETSNDLNKLKEKHKDRLTIYENLDVTSEENIDKLAKDFDKKAIDICILNAGIMPDHEKDKFGTLTKKNLMRVFEVNTVGPMLIAQALMPNLKLSQRKQIVVITSGLASIQDNASGGYAGYRVSKTGINSGMQDVKFRDKSIHTLLIEPGFVPTELTPINKQYASTPTEESVKGMIDAIDNYKNIPNGAFWSWRGTPFGTKKDANGKEKYPRGKW